MSQPSQPNPIPNSILDGLFQLSALAEATAGYVKQLVAGGITVETAEAMGLQYHTALMTAMTSGLAASIGGAKKGVHR